MYLWLFFFTTCRLLDDFSSRPYHDDDDERPYHAYRELLASTHGDHTVKITSFLRGRVVQTLRGHPRTPWTVKFHPKDPSIVASGCLDYEVGGWVGGLVARGRRGYFSGPNVVRIRSMLMNSN